MQDKKGNHHADDLPGEKSTHKNIGKQARPKTEHLIDAFEIVAGLVFGGLAFALADAGFHTLSLIFGFLAVVCGLAMASHLLQKYGLKHAKTGLVAALILTALPFKIIPHHPSRPASA